MADGTSTRTLPGSRYVIDHSELADIETRIARDLRKVGRSHTLQDIAAAANVIRTYPTAWPQWRATSPAEYPAQTVLNDWDAAKEEAADVTVWIKRLRMQAAAQLKFAEANDKEGEYRQRCADENVKAGRTASAADYAAQAEQQRSHAISHREDADNLTFQADTLERLGLPKSPMASLAAAFGVRAA